MLVNRPSFDGLADNLVVGPTYFEHIEPLNMSRFLYHPPIGRLVLEVQVNHVPFNH